MGWILSVMRKKRYSQCRWSQDSRIEEHKWVSLP